MIPKIGMGANLGSERTPSFVSIEQTSARVKKIILDNKTYPDLFKEFGEWNSIGMIFFEDVKNPSSTFDKENFAQPLFANVKNYPLENEIVWIIRLSSTSIQNNPANVLYFYLPPTNIWNSIHHNAIPDNIWDSTLPESQQKDYIQTSEGNVRRVTDGGTEIRLGNTFKEKIDVRSLLPFEGDMIVEGRFGNSIRIGSTVKNPKIKNIWSEVGEDGDPIIVIRNGQKEENKDPWIPILEDINNDKSSIYITSTQKIPIEVESKKYDSYENAPESPKEYKKPQYIVSSTRLLFNAKEDILFSVKNSINLNSQNSLNFDTKNKFTVDSPKIYLGSKKAKEPLILGLKAEKLLKKLLINLQDLCTVLPTVGTPSPGTPNIAVANSATKLSSVISQLLLDLEGIKSKQNFTL